MIYTAFIKKKKKKKRNLNIIALNLEINALLATVCIINVVVVADELRYVNIFSIKV